MSQFSDYSEPKILDALFNAVALTGPNSMFVALFTVTPTDVTASGTEVSTGATAYARVKIEKNGGSAPVWDLAVVDGAGFLVDNANTITFPTATGNWGDVKAFAIYDHVTTGNLLMWGPLTATKTVNANDTLKFPVGDLDLRCE